MLMFVQFWSFLRGEPLLILSTLSASLSMSYTAATMIRGRRSRRMKLRAAEEQQFQEVLESDDISRLGAYLDNTLGNFAVSEYADDKAVRRRVDSYLRRIQGFVGTIEDFKAAPPPSTYRSEQPISGPSPSGESAGSPQISLTPAPTDPLLDSSYQELREGEVWNSLAKMRRAVEIRLRKIATSAGLVLPKVAGAGLLLQELAKANLIDPHMVPSLRFSIYVANKAIHGETVSLPDAEIAIRQAADALSTLPDPMIASSEPGTLD